MDLIDPPIPALFDPPIFYPLTDAYTLDQLLRIWRASEGSDKREAALAIGYRRTARDRDLDMAEWEAEENGW